MIELTKAQRKAVARQTELPLRALDPDTHLTYVLIPESIYAELQSRASEDEADQLLQEMHPTVMEVFGREGWDDPAMDIYNDLDPRKQS